MKKSYIISNKPSNNVKIYLDFIDEHFDDIVKYVNTYFDNQKEDIKLELIRELKSYLDPMPVHYEWESDDCPWDYSGIIKEDGIISEDITVREFLEEEYTGNKTATYCSGYGFSYDRYEEKLSHKTMEIQGKLLVKAVKLYIEQNMNCNISKDDMESLIDITSWFDDIYGDSVAGDFFFSPTIAEYVGISEMTLKQIINYIPYC